MRVDSDKWLVLGFGPVDTSLLMISVISCDASSFLVRDSSDRKTLLVIGYICR